MDQFININDVSAKTGIPESTLRRYASTFNEYIHTKTLGRAKKYHIDSIDIFLKISYLYADGYSTTEVGQALSEDIPKIVVVDGDNGENTPQLYGIIEVLAQELKNSNDKYDQLLREVVELRRLVVECQKTSQQQQIEHDELIVARMRELLNNNKPWYKKIFK